MINANTCADNLFFRNERKKSFLNKSTKLAKPAERARVAFALLSDLSTLRILSPRVGGISLLPTKKSWKNRPSSKRKDRKEVAAWELKERGRGGKDVINLEEDDDDASRSDDLQMTMPTNQGFAWEGGSSMMYPNAFFPQWPTLAAFNQSIALNQASMSTPNFVSTILTTNPASFSGIVRGPEQSFYNNNIQLPFRVDKNRQRGYPWTMPQDSLFFCDNNMPTHSFQFEERRNSMPDSFQSGRVDQTTNFGFDTTRQHNRRASLFSSVPDMDPDITHESNFPPIEEIKRFFNINPETNKVETQKHPRHNSA